MRYVSLHPEPGCDFPNSCLLTVAERHGPSTRHPHQCKPVLIPRACFLLLIPGVRNTARISHAEIPHGQVSRCSDYSLGVCYSTPERTKCYNTQLTVGLQQCLRDSKLRLQEFLSSRCCTCTAWLFRIRCGAGSHSSHRHVGKLTKPCHTTVHVC